MIKQGSTYRDTRTGAKVMAMENALPVVPMARVREVITDEPWLGREYVAHADWLEALPVRYHSGVVSA